MVTSSMSVPSREGKVGVGEKEVEKGRMEEEKQDREEVEKRTVSEGQWENTNK